MLLNLKVNPNWYTPIPRIIASSNDLTIHCGWKSWSIMFGFPWHLLARWFPELNIFPSLIIIDHSLIHRSIFRAEGCSHLWDLDKKSNNVKHKLCTSKVWHAWRTLPPWRNSYCSQDTVFAEDLLRPSRAFARASAKRFDQRRTYHSGCTYEASLPCAPFRVSSDRQSSWILFHRKSSWMESLHCAGWCELEARARRRTSFHTKSRRSWPWCALSRASQGLSPPGTSYHRYRTQTPGSHYWFCASSCVSKIGNGRQISCHRSGTGKVYPRCAPGCASPSPMAGHKTCCSGGTSIVSSCPCAPSYGSSAHIRSSNFSCRSNTQMIQELNEPIFGAGARFSSWQILLGNQDICGSPWDPFQFQHSLMLMAGKWGLLTPLLFQWKFVTRCYYNHFLGPLGEFPCALSCSSERQTLVRTVDIGVAWLLCESPHVASGYFCLWSGDCRLDIQTVSPHCDFSCGLAVQNCPQRFSRIGNICKVSPRCEFLCAPEDGEGKNYDDYGDGLYLEMVWPRKCFVAGKAGKWTFLRVRSKVLLQLWKAAEALVTDRADELFAWMFVPERSVLQKVNKGTSDSQFTWRDREDTVYSTQNTDIGRS